MLKFQAGNSHQFTIGITFRCHPQSPFGRNAIHHQLDPQTLISLPQHPFDYNRGKGFVNRGQG